MLGHRGCRLGITYPEITEMQARAIFEAVVDVKMKGETVLPEVMIPLVGGEERVRPAEGDASTASPRRRWRRPAPSSSTWSAR